METDFEKLIIATKYISHLKMKIGMLESEIQELKDKNIQQHIQNKEQRLHIQALEKYTEADKRAFKIDKKYQEMRSEIIQRDLIISKLKRDYNSIIYKNRELELKLKQLIQ